MELARGTLWHTCAMRHAASLAVSLNGWADSTTCDMKTSKDPKFDRTKKKRTIDLIG